MSKENIANKVTEPAKGKIAEKLDSVGWALFFIWVGIALLFDVGWGVGLLGIGIITLGGQVARKYFDLKMEGLWVVVGCFFLLGGIWELFEATLPLLPILLIIAGFVMLLSVLRGKHSAEKNSLCE